MSARMAAIAAAALAASAAAACAQQSSAAPGPGPGPDGQALFVEKCAMCHREANRLTGMGTFLIERRDPSRPAALERRPMLTPQYIELAVRTGLFNMPRISRGEVSDAELAAISAYLVESAAAHAAAPGGGR